MEADQQALDGAAAIDAAQQQLGAAALAMLVERLRVVAQAAVDEELASLRSSGALKLPNTTFEISVQPRDDG